MVNLSPPPPLQKPCIELKCPVLFWNELMSIHAGFYMIYRISPCIMQCFFLAIHVTKRHLVLYMDVEFNEKI